MVVEPRLKFLTRRSEQDFAAQPPGDLRQCAPLLIRLRDEGIQNACAGCVLRHDIHAPASPVAAVCDEWHECLAGEVVLGQKRPDHRGGGFSPDLKAVKYD